MFCTKNDKKIINCTKKKSSKCGAFMLGAAFGAAMTAAICISKKAKKKCKCIKEAIKSSVCDCTDNSYENFCTCDEKDDHERARNGFDCHSDAEECDTHLLHSHGCLGYPHDNFGGFANSNGDRPSDLSNPEIDNQMGIPEGNTSPYWAKNAGDKSNPQPENKVNEVKKKK